MCALHWSQCVIKHAIQFLADILQIPIERPVFTETTALGSAFVGAITLGWIKLLDEIDNIAQCEREFLPHMSNIESKSLYLGWLDAVARIRG